MAVAGKNGVTAATPKKISFGAGTIHKGLKYTSDAWNFDNSIIGATSGGSKITITPEVTAVEVDGALVKVKGLDVKTGETATMEINFIELNEDILKAATLGQNGTSVDTTYSLIESKSSIVTGDYFENIAFVGQTIEGKKIIVIMDNAICTSGMELEGKNKEAGVITLTFECSAEIGSDLDKLPWHIYMPVDEV